MPFTEFSGPLVIPITENFTHFTSNVRRLIRTKIPVREKLGTITIRHRGDDRPFNFEPASWGSLTIFVPNFFCPPTIYMSGVSVIINGSSLKYGWHHSVSGAVGAMCRHLKVDSRSDKRVLGGIGTYFSMSFNGCPELISKLLLIDALLEVGMEAFASGLDTMFR